MSSKENDERVANASPWAVLLVFLRLGCTSFGGPIAHIGYFREEFVARKKWCSESTYGELLAIAHSLPGPSSSQIGFAIGLLRAGWPGGLAAWVGFTLPSAVLMTAFAFGYDLWNGAGAARVFHGLQLVAVAVVAQAVVSMQRTLAPDVARILLAIVSAVLVVLLPWTPVSLIVLVSAGLLGLLLFRGLVRTNLVDSGILISRSAGLVAGSMFVCLLIAALALSLSMRPSLAALAAIYRSGALVFGGGHVVLPLLEHAVVAPGWVPQQAFLAGYGAAQAMPGPLFSFAAYVGAAMGGADASAPHRLIYAMVSLVALFLPGLLAMAAVLPFWSALRANVRLRAALLGINAGVVGVLAAALVRPLISSTIHSGLDGIIAIAAFVALSRPRVQPWMVVAGVTVLTLAVR